MFAEPFFLLSREGFIVRSCLCSGLTEIRNANLDEKGRYYSGFFQLTIGLERMAKLAIILEYMVSNGLSVPASSSVRNYGHDLERLFATLKKITEKYEFPFLAEFDLAANVVELLLFFKKFALGSRYANLDALAGGSPKIDPLQEWQGILAGIITKYISPGRVDKILAQASRLADSIRPHTSLYSFDLKNRPLKLEEYLAVPTLFNNAAKYVVLEITMILRPIIRLIGSLTRLAQQIDMDKGNGILRIPYLEEFFFFLPEDRAYILRKKRWP